MSTSLPTRLRAAFEFGELPTKIAMRSELVNRMVNQGLNSLSREELDGLHALDKELSGLNAVEVLLERLKRTAAIETAMIAVCEAAEAQVTRWYREPPVAEGGDFLAGMHELKVAIAELERLVGEAKR
jgi:hypothetical protein